MARMLKIFLKEFILFVGEVTRLVLKAVPEPSELQTVSGSVFEVVGLLVVVVQSVELIFGQFTGEIGEMGVYDSVMRAKEEAVGEIGSSVSQIVNKSFANIRAEFFRLYSSNDNKSRLK